MTSCKYILLASIWPSPTQLRLWLSWLAKIHENTQYFIMVSFDLLIIIIWMNRLMQNKCIENIFHQIILLWLLMISSFCFLVIFIECCLHSARVSNIKFCSYVPQCLAWPTTHSFLFCSWLGWEHNWVSPYFSEDLPSYSVSCLKTQNFSCQLT